MLGEGTSRLRHRAAPRPPRARAGAATAPGGWARARGARGLVAAVPLLVLLGQALPARAADPAPALPSPPRLRLSGIVALDEDVAHQAAGTPPRSTRELPAWAEAAARRIVIAYRSRQYRYARAWSHVEPDGSIRIHVDEGRMRVMFSGVRGVRAVLMRLSLALPNDVFHQPTVTRMIADLKRRHNLLNVYYRIREPGELEITPFDQAVPLRVLQIYIVTRDVSGWGVEVGSSSTWGLLLGVGYQRRLFWRGDRFRGKVEFAFPYRRYVFDEDPSLQFVRAGLELSYRLPRLVLKLAPRVDDSLYLSHYDRGDVGIASYYLLRNTALAGLVVPLPWLEASLAGGVDVARVYRVQLLEGTTVPDPPTDTLSVRGLARLAARLESGSSVMRHDYRSFVALRVDAASADGRRWLIAGDTTGQLFLLTHRHRFILRAHGVLLAGDVRFWDEVALAGSYQRVYFQNRYWVHQAAQFETAYRVNTWWEWLDVGFFHDISVFEDRSRPDMHPVAWANAFGPSVHFLLLDLLALDFYAGFGWAPVGFGNTISFSLQTIF